MKLVHISDTHLTVPGERMGGLNPHLRLAKALDEVRTQHSDASRIIITGDLTHWGEPKAYLSLVDNLKNLPCPVRLLVGNHDDRTAFLAAFPDYSGNPAGFINYAETIEDTRLIYLDTTQPRTHAGHFCAARRDWLREELNKCTRARLFMHHNPMPLGLPAEDKIALVPEDRIPLAELLNTFRERIDYIHFGHVHAPIHGTWCGIQFASVRSTGNQSIPDLIEQESLQGAPMAPSFSVILVTEEGTTIHEIPFTWEGPVFSTGTAWEDWAKPTAAE